MSNYYHTINITFYELFIHKITITSYRNGLVRGNHPFLKSAIPTLIIKVFVIYDIIEGTM